MSLHILYQCQAQRPVALLDLILNDTMMRYTFGLLFTFILSTSWGQNQTSVPKQHNREHRSGIPESQLKEAAASKVPMSMVRNVRLAKNGDILIASYVGVYRYDGTSF